MLRFLQRKLVLCVLLIVGFATLKQMLPEIGSTIGDWITGAEDSRIATAFSDMYGALKKGQGIGNAVEVFYDGLQDTQSD